MKLKQPAFISARLLPAVKVSDATISMERAGRDEDNRQIWRYYIDSPEFEYSASDLKSGCGSDSTQEAFKNLIGFLEACGESANIVYGTGKHGENYYLFPEHVAEWCGYNSDELQMLSLELEETQLIED